MSVINDAVKNSVHGVIIRVHVVPGSSETLFPAGYNPWRNCIETKVQSAAQENKANIEIIETIAWFFGLPARNVLLVSGEKSREKTLVLKGISLDSVLKKLHRVLHE